MKNMFSGFGFAPTFNPELRGYTGRIFEREVLGECRVRAHGKMGFYASLKEVMRGQPSNTFEPMGETDRFYTAVCGQMRRKGLNPVGLQIYTAVGSSLDRFHGIDGFFSFEGIIVTVDCTINPHKDVTKARVLVTGEDFVAGYHDVAEDIAARFKTAIHCGWKGVI